MAQPPAARPNFFTDRRFVFFSVNVNCPSPTSTRLSHTVATHWPIVRRARFSSTRQACPLYVCW